MLIIDIDISGRPKMLLPIHYNGNNKERKWLELNILSLLRVTKTDFLHTNVAVGFLKQRRSFIAKVITIYQVLHTF